MIGPHLLGIAGLNRDQVEYVINSAESFLGINERSVKKVPTLRGKTVVNLFYEVSTRTRTSFEIAAKRLSADAVNISAQSSSVTKGETLIDTGLTIQAMSPDLIVMRHPDSGAPHLLARTLPNVGIINAGDGLHEHPTQAFLDALTMKREFGRLTGLTIVLVGDVLRSRVARSNMLLHQLMGNTVRVVGPPTLVLPQFTELGVEVYYDLARALDGADVVMSMRMKQEYLAESFVPSTTEYARRFCIKEQLLAKYAPKSIVLAPGPYNRGSEISSEVIDGPRSRYAVQVSHGVAVRMSVLFLLCQYWARKRNQEAPVASELAAEG